MTSPPVNEKAAMPVEATTPTLARTDTTTKETSQESPLERFTSYCSATVPPQAGIEPLAAGGVTMMAQQRGVHHNYYFKFLAEDKPLPGKKLEWAMLTTLSMVMFLAGWNDGSQGPLLPSLQKYYNVNYLVISIIWLFNATGFSFAGFSNVWFSDHFGFGIVAPFGAMLQVVAYSLMCWGPPYPLFVFAFVLNGWGIGLQDAQVNSLTARLPNANTKMFLMHAWYGLGATAAPLVSTQFVKSVQDRVYLYYCVSLGLAVTIVAMLFIVFRMRTEDQIVGKRGAATPVATPPNERADEVPMSTVPSGRSAEAQVEAGTLREASPSPPPDKVEASGAKMGRIIRTPSVWFMSVYILLYVGIEVTIGGWATSFLIAERGGDDSSGYVAAGFFGGLTLGRVILIPVTTWIGRSNSVWVYTVISIALEIVVWTTHSIVGNAVAFAFVGILLGPCYPIVMMVITDVIPGDLQSGTIGLVASLGQVGSAIMPFIAGSISEKHGVWILQPLMVAMMGFSLIWWALVPRAKKGWHA